MKATIGYRIGYNVTRALDKSAMNTVTAFNTAGDAITDFFGDIRKGYRRAKGERNVKGIIVDGEVLARSVC